MNARRVFIATGFGGAVLPPISSSAGCAKKVGGPDGFPNPLPETHTGERLRFYDDIAKSKKVLMLNMMYAGCSNICPPNTANLLHVQRLLGKRLGRDVGLNYSICFLNNTV